MQTLGLFHYLQPYFFSGLLDDPVLFINIRPTGRGILIDCGQLHHLAKRVMRSLDAIFVSHAHMDHLMGFDHVLRHVLVAPRTITVYGPPGISERIGHKLAGYDWNLTEENWCTIAVDEIHPDRIERSEFAGSRGFIHRYLQTLDRHDRLIYRTRHLQVEAELCDHKLPVLIFRITEARSFLLDKQRLQKERLLPGSWLKELKKRFYGEFGDNNPLEVWRETSAGPAVETIDDAKALYSRICRDVSPASIGYVSDIGMTPDNLARVGNLLNGVTLLVSECTFLAEDQAKARISAHLCTSDLNRICHMVKPELLLPMHLSKSYIDDPHSLYAELELPPGTRLLQLPDYMTPRPLLPNELPCPISLPS